MPFRLIPGQKGKPEKKKLFFETASCLKKFLFLKKKLLWKNEAGAGSSERGCSLYGDSRAAQLAVVYAECGHGTGTSGRSN
jgi:hypothetical protein